MVQRFHLDAAWWVVSVETIEVPTLSYQEDLI
jgi:hypothetical protein